MKIVINKCYGGFGLSHKATMEYAQRKGFKLYSFVDKRDEKGCLIKGKNGELYEVEPYDGTQELILGLLYYYKSPEREEKSFFAARDIERNDSVLVQIVEEMEKDANGSHANLKVVEIPDGVQWEIEEYDGIEWIAEAHRTWD